MTATAHSSSFRPRPSGGFGTGMGQFGEHLDEAALQQAVTQKQLGQQQAAGAGSPQGVATSQNPLSPSAVRQPTPPREVGTLTEELITRPAVDVVKGLLSLFDFSAALGLKPPETKSPEEKARATATHQRYQKLNQEQQAFARKKYQETIQKKQAEQEVAERQKQQRQQAAAQEIVIPSSAQKGPIGPSGSSKQRAVTKLQHDRQTLGGPASAN